VKRCQPIGGRAVSPKPTGPKAYRGTENREEDASSATGAVHLIATIGEGAAQCEITPTRAERTNPAITKLVVARRRDGFTTSHGSGRACDASDGNLALRRSLGVNGA